MPTAPSIIRLTLLARPGCHLCAEAKQAIRRLQRELPFTLQLLNIDQHEALTDRYGDRIPVVLIDDQEQLAGRFTEQELRRAIEKARGSRPISRILSHLRSTLRRG